MGAIDVQKLLRPVSSDAPSGVSLEYLPEYGEMTRLAQGKPERQAGATIVPAEEPNWKEVGIRAQQLLGRSKDLRVGVYLTRALLRTDGLPGFSAGLELLRGLLEVHWDTVHPQLDPEDGNDPTSRVNTIAALCHPETVLKSLREAPLATSRAGRASLRDVLIATGKIPPPPEGAPATASDASVDAVFGECDLGALQATAEAVLKSIEHVEAIESVLTGRVGTTQATGFGELSGTLKNAQRVLAERLARRGVATTAVEGETVDQTQSRMAPAAQGVPGEIRSRDDAVRVIDRVCEYFQTHEPSSPVPLLLRRAQRLVSKGFEEIVRDLAPEGLPQVEKIRGEKSDA